MRDRERRRWLHSELAVWEREGIVETAQANALRERYPCAGEDRRFGVLLFGGIGAVVVGLGVILMFAYNWAEMSKFSKLGVVFATFLAAQLSGYFLRYRASRPLAGELLTLLGTMFFGAAIFLIAQIYHLSSHYPNAFWFWGLGAIGMAWALPSVAQGLLATLILTLWAGMELCAFHEPMVLRPLAVIIASAALAWHLRSELLLWAAGISAYLILCFFASYSDGRLFPYIIMLTGGLYAAMAEGLALWDEKRFPAASEILGKLAVNGLLFASFLLGFEVFHREQIFRHLREWSGLADYSCWVLALLGLAGLLGTMLWGQRRGRDSWRHLLWPLLAVLAATTALLNGRFGSGQDGVLMAKTLVFHALYVLPVLWLLWSGCDRGEARQIFVHALLLSLWFFARYCDWFESLFTRGLAFIALGGLLFYLSLRYHRRKQTLNDAGGPEHA
jgi:uncharacterized membrane protein